ncbi:MAG: GDP-mannose 4,6-dehydratase [Elusimicrobiota bacterium]|nr:GDP-mannose 4,6-dehydratase [Elusimicrobiota bacterium]
MRKALITGITGQDGSYLAEFLLSKGYRVHGVQRRSSLPNDGRLASLPRGPRGVTLHDGDMTDGGSLARILAATRPDEVYNLAAQSHVASSFAEPEYTANADGLGALRLLEAMRTLGLRKTRFYQASTSELFGKVRETPQSEGTPFHPRSPYGVAKLYAYWITVNYREAYGLYACNGVLFNHESPRRGEEFVTRKITRGLARLKLGLQGPVRLGNLDAKRDWGHARDFVEMMWLMLRRPKPQDYVVATGRQRTVREFTELAAARLGLDLAWRGKGLAERGVDRATGRPLVVVDRALFRPSEVDSLLGDAAKARRELGWKPRTSFAELVAEMAAEDLRLAERERLARRAGL